jgi:hypothetical protein
MLYMIIEGFEATPRRSNVDFARTVGWHPQCYVT